MSFLLDQVAGDFLKRTPEPVDSTVKNHEPYKVADRIMGIHPQHEPERSYISGPQPWCAQRKEIQKAISGSSADTCTQEHMCTKNVNVFTGLIVTSALIIWKTLMLITGSESPIVVVLSGSMEPGFYRGDILFLHLGKSPIRSGEIVVYNVDGRDIPIVHRVLKVHEREEKGLVDILTKV